MAGEEGIREVERSSQILVWRIENDTSARYVCIVAHDVTMSSASVHPRPSCLSPCTVVTRAPLLFICRTGKDARTQRITHILRPNVNAPGLSCARNTRDAAPNRSLLLLTLFPRLRSTLVALGHPVHRRRVGRAFRDRLRIANPELPAHPHRHRAPCADITSEADVGAETGRCGHRSRAGNQGAPDALGRHHRARLRAGSRLIAPWVGFQRRLRVRTMGEGSASTTAFSDRSSFFLFHSCTYAPVVQVSVTMPLQRIYDQY